MSTPAPQDSPSIRALQHEFDQEQNRIIGDLAGAMRWVAAPLLFLGFIYGVAVVLGIFQAFARPETLVSVLFIALAALFFLGLGAWTRQAADSFHRITVTSGQDVAHLMDALDHLRKKYSLLSAVVKFYCALVILGLIVMLISVVAGAFKS